jgi:hypothetical protein
MGDMVIRSATIWSGALQAAATVLGAWHAPRSSMPKAGDIVRMAAEIIMEMPDDPESGVREARNYAKEAIERRAR